MPSPTFADSTSPASGTTGAGCVPTCGEKHCGDDGCGGLCEGRESLASWRVDFDLGPNKGGQKIVPWPEGNSVFILHETDVVTRLDMCDGAALAQRDLGPNVEPLVATVEGGQLVVAVQGDDQLTIQRLDPLTLADAAPQTAILGNERLSVGGVRHQDAFLIPAFTSATVERVDFTGGNCFASSGTPYNGRAMVVSGNTILASFTGYDEGYGYSMVADFGNIDATCPQASRKTPYAPYEIFALIVDGNDVIGIGSRISQPNGEYSRIPYIERRSLTDLSVTATWSGAVTPWISGLYDGIVLDGRITAVGQWQGGSNAPDDLGAKGVIAALDADFTMGMDAPVRVAFPSVNRISAIRREAEAIYLTGRAPILDHVGGFVSKCSLELQCGLGPGELLDQD